MQVEDLLGSWKLDRTITDHATKKTGHMRGSCVFTRTSKNTLLYKETVTHETITDSTHVAKKFYEYKFHEDFIELYFYNEESNRLFMILDENLQGEGICGKDHYHCMWSWENPQKCTQTFQVKGPRKNYSIHSIFTKHL